MKDLLSYTIQTAKGAGRILMQHFGRIEHVKHKDIDSIVTEADIRAEKYIRRRIAEVCPDHRVLGEEQGLDPVKAEYTWVVDPLDGTSNFAAGLPLFAVSIALFRKKQPVLAVVYDPVLRHSYWASEEMDGARKDGDPIRVSERDLTPTTLAVFGSSWNHPDLVHIPTRIITRYKGRNLGSAVLQLISIASGQVEFAISDNVRLWDVAAAGFILVKAGGKLTDLSGKNLFPLKLSFEEYSTQSLCVIASTSHVHRKVMREIVLKNP